MEASPGPHTWSSSWLSLLGWGSPGHLVKAALSFCLVLSGLWQQPACHSLRVTRTLTVDLTFKFLFSQRDTLFSSYLQIRFISLTFDYTFSLLNYLFLFSLGYELCHFPRNFFLVGAWKAAWQEGRKQSCIMKTLSTKGKEFRCDDLRSEKSLRIS